MEIKVFARMIDDSYRALTPEHPYEVDYRIGDNHFVIKGSPARYSTKSFVFTTETGIIIDRTYLWRFVQSKNQMKRRGWKNGNKSKRQ